MATERGASAKAVEAAFETMAISRSEWTHEAHVRMAWLHLICFSAHEATSSIRAGIQMRNVRSGVISGNHETITAAFVRLIAARLLHHQEYEV